MKRHQSFIGILLALLLGLLSTMLSASELKANSNLVGNWKGELKVSGVTLPVIIHLSEEDGQQKGSLDTPSQGGFDIPMSKLAFDSEKLLFEIADLSIHYEGKYDAEKQQISGNFIQGGVLKLSFSRIINSQSNDSNDIVGTWNGVIPIPNNPLTFVIHVKQNGEQLSATADSPDQEVYGMEIDGISFQNGILEFNNSRLQMSYRGNLNADKKTISGIFSQSGNSLGLELSKGASKKKVSLRPQTPKAPFDYQIEDLLVENKSANISLAGTLTKPKSGKIKAVAVLISGSGPQDRNETIMRHKPFWVIADYLTRQGFAVFRMDDRGTAQSTGDFSSATSEDFVTDIDAAVSYLKTRKDLPADKIGLIGHSEGGMIAPMLASKRNDIAFVIMLAGPGIKNSLLYAEQQFLIGKDQGADTAKLAAKRKNDENLYELIAKSDRTKILSQKINGLVEKSITIVSGHSSTATQKQLDLTLETLNSSWFRFFLSYDPADYLAKVNAPILAINGSNDLQVASQSNLAGIEQILKSSKHDDFRTQELANLNHLFQTSITGSISEYSQLTETFSPEALTVINQWLQDRF